MPPGANVVVFGIAGASTVVAVIGMAGAIVVGAGDVVDAGVSDAAGEVMVVIFWLGAKVFPLASGPGVPLLPSLTPETREVQSTTSNPKTFIFSRTRHDQKRVQCNHLDSDHESRLSPQ